MALLLYTGGFGVPTLLSRCLSGPLARATGLIMQNYPTYNALEHVLMK